jgi:hypothetical protein
MIALIVLESRASLQRHVFIEWVRTSTYKKTSKVIYFSTAAAEAGFNGKITFFPLLP